MAEKTIEFTGGVSGYINKVGTGYSAATGAANCDTAMNGASPFILAEKRAFFQFDTSSIPSSAVITKVEFYVYEDQSLQPATAPDEVRMYIGDWIGASLDNSAADFDGGTYTDIDVLSYGHDVWIDLTTDSTEDPIQYVQGGTIDIALRPFNSASKNSGRNYNELGKGLCKLRVTYNIPRVIKIIQ